MASDYHARIMNIPCEKRGLYAQGHRDARQAAAEIASEAEAEVERLEEERSGLQYTVKGLIAANRQMADRIKDREAEVERLREVAHAAKVVLSLTIVNKRWPSAESLLRLENALAALAGEGDKNG